ncbi:MAG: hypothetical protein JO284_08635 [Planctomycetaceae bacterium]|nr:hypothetical protein [Planctomycetaceae bacterium]MBV8612100.1 hypothetical protein [Singulisphaera sp.]
MAEEARQEMLRALDDGTELTGSYDADWAIPSPRGGVRPLAEARSRRHRR